MKLFYFSPKEYGVIYYVMSYSLQDAINYLIKYLERKLQEDIKEMKLLGLDEEESSYFEELELWEKVDVFDVNTYPNNYKIIEFNEGEVLESEID